MGGILAGQVAPVPGLENVMWEGSPASSLPKGGGFSMSVSSPGSGRTVLGLSFSLTQGELVSLFLLLTSLARWQQSSGLCRDGFGRRARASLRGILCLCSRVTDQFAPSLSLSLFLSGIRSSNH